MKAIYKDYLHIICTTSQIGFAAILHIRLYVAMDDNIDQMSPTKASAMAGELRVLMSKLRRRTREARPPGGFSESQLLVLSRLEREGAATVTTLAHAEGVRPQSMGATIASLEEVDFVSRAPDPSDGRQTILSLTPAAIKMIEAYRAARDDWLSNAVQTKLTASEQQHFAKSLELLKRLIDA